ncbi:uncharacterized protein LOC123550156 [Mercenaria mercenaria]|uniref:uncharacterized protein LOC123550156 n=1 Tax=Mercenaria mercenaria TaxID=6596 RepID=UPI00234F6ADC|nr:uncharacterized protein LOC123550156 [Mercenaria mercenaria]
MAPNDYKFLEGVSTVGLYAALFCSTVADITNIYNMKVTNSSTDVAVVLWLLGLSFCFQVGVALLAVIMYMINMKEHGGRKEKPYKRLRLLDSEKPEQGRFDRRMCCRLSLYKILYIACLICILVIIPLQISASMLRASIGIKLSPPNEEVGLHNIYSTLNPNLTTAMEAYKSL